MGLIRLGNKPPLTVAPEDTVVRAARAMTERRVGAATVLEGTRVVGVVTERDAPSPPEDAPYLSRRRSRSELANHLSVPWAPRPGLVGLAVRAAVAAPVVARVAPARLDVA